MIIYTNVDSNFNLFTFLYNQIGVEMKIEFRELNSIERSLFARHINDNTIFVIVIDAIQIDRINGRGSVLESLLNIDDFINLIIVRRDEAPMITYAVNENDPNAIALWEKTKVISDY